MDEANRPMVILLVYGEKSAVFFGVLSLLYGFYHFLDPPPFSSPAAGPDGIRDRRCLQLINFGLLIGGRQPAGLLLDVKGQDPGRNKCDERMPGWMEYLIQSKINREGVKKGHHGD